MSPGPRLTEAQQTAAIDRAEETLALQSGAGCGKTLVLSMRFAELLSAQADDAEALSQLVAITFTDKAAIEMQQRVRRELFSLAQKATGPKRLRLQQWIQQLPDARISTIHSFCASLLRRWALEAGLDPGFAVCADDLITSFMITEAAEEAMLHAVQSGRSGALELLANTRFDTARDQIIELVRQRGLHPPESYLDAKATLCRWREAHKAAAGKAWAQFETASPLPELLDALAAANCSDDSDKLLPYRDAALDLARALLTDPAHRTAETIQELCGIRPGNLGSDKHWGGKGTARDVRHQIATVRDTIEPMGVYARPLGPSDQRAAEALAAVAALACDTVGLYEVEKRSRGVLDFDDLQIRARRLLTENPSVRRAVSEQVRQFLVDECQDTDAMQFDLLNLLVSGEADNPAAGPEGKLFMVGDAKQSIYRFRGAQVDVYQAMCDRLGPDRNEELDISFRTHAAGVAFINRLFQPLMGDDYTPITAYRKETPEQPSVEILLAGLPGGQPVETADQATAAQAAVTAGCIREMLDDSHPRVWDRDATSWRPARPADIAILFGRMTQSLEYERQLAAMDIPYYVVAGTGFFQQQEVFDVLNAVQAVDTPYDDIAFMGLLRSSMVGLDDSALMRISMVCKPPYFPALTAADAGAILDGDASTALTEALAMVTHYHRIKDAVGPDVLIERILTATGYEATLLSQGRGTRPLGNVRMLLERARAAADDGMTVADFVNQCDELVLSESRYEQAAVAGESDDVVRLMTIHKAKGLEFPIVILPDLNAGRRDASGALIGRADIGLVYRPANSDTDNQEPETPTLYDLARALEKEDDAREDIRRLYVAATRHQDHLVFIGAQWRAKDGHLLAKGSQLQRLDSVLKIDEALAADGTIRCSRKHVAVVRCAEAPAQRRSRRAGLPGWKLLAHATSAEDLADRIAQRAPHDGQPPLLGPIPPQTGRVEIAVTALGDFAWCPMLYRWRYELKVPPGVLPHTEGTATGSAGRDRLDAATLGTLLHRCMELLDFQSPQPAGALVNQAAAEMDLLACAQLDTVADQLDAMLQQMSGGALWQQIATAKQRLCELDFELASGPAVLRGQIDLLYQDSEDAWHIVDYKSDRVDPEHAAEHSQRYRLQMAAYTAAAARHVGQAPEDAQLYFLRCGAVVPLSATGEAHEADDLEALAMDLLNARRSKDFPKRLDSYCHQCPYEALCSGPQADPQA